MRAAQANLKSRRDAGTTKTAAFTAFTAETQGAQRRHRKDGGSLRITATREKSLGGLKASAEGWQF